MAAQLTEKLTKLPAVPKQFGQDGGFFFKYYDELADELDEDMVTSLKAQLDGILIFAGLFAGVNSAFLAFTLPQMSADPADDTNALLFQIMRGANATITSPADLPSASFSPPTGALPINILFSMSLTLALLASFLAVLGQQWLVYYRKRSGGGAERQRWEQLRRYMGAKRWRLELILDDVLPSVLQIGLVIFCIAFILYLGTLSRTLCYAIAAPLCAVAGLIVAMAILTAWDHWCPFKSPLTHLMQPIMKHTIAAFGRVTSLPVSLAVMTFQWLAHIIRSGFVPFTVEVWIEDYGFSTLRFGGAVLHRAKNISNWFQSHSERNADAIDYLEVMAVKRVICTSEDPNALVYASTNEYIWHLSLGITQAKVRDGDSSQEGDLEWERTAISELRNVLSAHQTRYKEGPMNTYDVISDAIGTLTSPWKGSQPEIELYEELFEQALIPRRDFPHTTPPSVLKALLVFIRFLESQIRDPTTPASTRERAKEYRTKYSKMFAASLDGEIGWIRSRIVFALYAGFCSDAIQQHLEWMKNHIFNDPTNPDNPPLVESFKICFRLFPHPDTIFEDVGEQTRAVYRRRVEEYYTLYPIIVRALSEIEAAVMPPTAGSSPEKRDVTISQPDLDLVAERKNQHVDVGSEWWGN
ncbi:hypothetical protein FRC00_001091 [Tulasnella sp. 408]|nr:hypothetical protein FRC00_001091 [Tulasnella sp. 408]